MYNRMDSDPSTSTSQEKEKSSYEGGKFSCEDEVNTSLIIKTNEATFESGLHDAIEKNKRLLEKLKKRGVMTPCLMAKDGSKAKSLKVTGKVKLSQEKKKGEGCTKDGWVSKM